jgi:polyribonucleotide nucleotidyltransferase
VLSLNPDAPYDVLAINAASASTQISGLPFSGPIGATRVALIDGDWVAFPTHTQLESAVFDMVVAGRLVDDGSDGGDVAIMMVEAESTEQTWELVRGGRQAPTEEVVAEGLEASKRFIRQLCLAQRELAAASAKEVREFPRFLDYSDDVLAAVSAAAARTGVTAAVSFCGKAEREERLAPSRPPRWTASVAVRRP